MTWLFLTDWRTDDEGNYIGFKKLVPNAGPRFIDADNGDKLVAFTDDNGVSYGGIGLLDANGHKLTAGADAVLLTIDCVPDADFGDPGVVQSVVR